MPREFGAASLTERAILERHPARGVPPPAPPCTPLPGRTTVNFIDIEGAQILLRVAGDLGGSAEPELLIHHAPGSTALYEQRMLAAAATRPVIAFDLPGHGESDALPGNPQDIATWTRVALKVLEQLGIGSVHLRGHNGGAAVALELAHLLGNRARSLTLDAPLFVGETDRARLAADYAPAVEPAWDGSHWLRAWHHLRDSELWWPWFERTRHNVRATPRIDPAELTLRVREAMKQPYSYAPAWRANIGYAWHERLAHLKLPLTLMAADDDTFAHLLPAVRAANPNKP